MVTLRHILSLCALLLFAALSTPPADAARAHDATYDNNQAAYVDDLALRQAIEKQLNKV